MNVGILDSGAPNSVCGTKWLKCYLRSLSENDQKQVKYGPTNDFYKFGWGRKIKADHNVTIPAVIGNTNIWIKVDTVQSELPLLLSRQFMKKTKAVLDFEDDTIQILNQKLNLILIRSGHYALPLDRNQQIIKESKRNPDVKLTLHAENMSAKEAPDISCESSDIGEQIIRQEDLTNDCNQHKYPSKSENSSIVKEKDLPKKHRRHRKKKQNQL